MEKLNVAPLQLFVQRVILLPTLYLTALDAGEIGVGDAALAQPRGRAHGHSLKQQYAHEQSNRDSPMRWICANASRQLTAVV